jgi:molybdenum cofactor cytidylyltransferase
VRERPIVGILLAAGSASRFGGEKLLARLPDGTPIGVAALRHLAAAVDTVVAVVRSRDELLAAALAEGMGASLAWGVCAAPVAAAWVIALADMPWVEPVTMAGVVDALHGGATVAAPSYRGRRGHPVGFAARCYGELSALSGDEGAKAVVDRYQVTLIDTDDAGVLRDVDTRQDLET